MPHLRPFTLLAFSSALLLGCTWSAAQAAVNAPTIDPATVNTAVSVISSPNDAHRYRALQLDNHLKVVLIHDPEATHAAAALNVLAGSAQDPKDMPGLAHFVEHLVFLGSEQYPEPEGYITFMNKQGGRYNASTSEGRTQYQFSVPGQALPEALSRFSQMLAAPLFDEHYVDRERHAVDAEFRLRLDQDAGRVFEAIGLALNPANPLAGFHIGNLDTLKDGAVPLRQRALDFYHQHYSANLMYLAVSGPQSLDELQGLVTTNFSAIVDRQLNAPLVSEPMALVRQLPATLQVRTEAKTDSAMFLFPVPYAPEDERLRPLDYVTLILAEKGPGSLHQQLSGAGLAQAVEAGRYISQNRQVLMAVKVQLTPDGLEQLDRVQATLTQYLQMIADEGLQDWRFQAMAYRLQQRFEQPPQMNPLNQVLSVAYNMTLYPLQDALYGPYRTGDFSPQRLREVLAAMAPDNLLRVSLSNRFETQSTGPVFAAPYTLQQPVQWAAAQPLEGLALPAPNRFVADDRSMLAVQADKPVQVINTPAMDVWYLPDSRFHVSKVVWNIDLQSPQKDRGARSRVLSHLLLNAFNESFEPVKREAALAGLYGAAWGSSNGIALRISGERQHQEVLLEQMLGQLISAPITDAAFERLRHRLAQNYGNERKGLLLDLLVLGSNQALYPDALLDTERLAVLKTLKPQDLRDYRRQWLSRLHVQAMAVGNLEDSTVHQVAQRLQNSLHPSIASAAIPALKLRRLAANLPALYPSSQSQDSGLLLYMPILEESARGYADGLLLGQQLSSPFYFSLRTQQQLGYAVSARARQIQRQIGIELLIQSHNTPSATLKARTEAFLQDYDQKFAALDEATLQTVRTAVLRNLQVRDDSLDVLADRRWGELQAGYLKFDRRKQVAEQIRARTPAQLAATWKLLRSGPSLSVMFDPGKEGNLHTFQRSATLLAPPLLQAALP